ncbi:MAG: ABC-F family ATP-binding cassette domain-containing protein [Candidatus Aminicenantes bacterium]
MLQLKDIHFSIGDLKLLNGVEWSIPKGKRNGLLGPNGAGKTTLLRIISGEIEPDKGHVLKPKKYNIGYLPQEEVDVKGGILLNSVMKSCEEIHTLERKITDLHDILDSNHQPNDRLLKQLGEYEQKYEAAGGYNLENRARAVLSGLGFEKKDLNRCFSEFSGGWRMRAHLARILLQEPDLLLLDEPSNHLDLPSLEWLEQYLLEFSGTIVIVSHDRFFIDQLVQNIYELNHGKLDYYAGNYSYYEKEKKKREELLEKKIENQKSEISRQEEFIQRFRYKKTRAAQVQSRIKKLEKMERIEKPSRVKKVSFNLSAGVKSYKDVLKIKDLYFKYHKDWILEGLNLHVLRGDKIALVGENGAGKTTLTRLIAGKLKPQKGTIELGKRTHIGYYAQHQAFDLNDKAAVFEEVADSVSTNNILKIREALGLFQFSGDDVNKNISVLSGGEKARISLVKILLSDVNFLIMDEPTNHLDIMSLEALEEALKNYNGTLMVISHDRFFLDKLVSRVVEIKDKKIKQFIGNYSYYLEKRTLGQESNKKSVLKKDNKMKVKKIKTKEQKREEAEKRQRISKERNRLEIAINDKEEKIERLEDRKKEIENLFCLKETHKNGKYVASLQKELGEIKKELKELYNVWEEKKTSLEQLLKQSRI